jgi:YTH domain-containing family protein
MTAGGGSRINPTGLRRSGTLQATIKHSENPRSPSPTQAEDGDHVDDPQSLEDERYQPDQVQGQYLGSPIGHHSPWSSQAEWRTGGNGNTTNPTIDDVSRALSAIELSVNNGPGQPYNQNSITNNYPMGQSTHPPRFNPMQQGHTMQQTTVRRDSINNGQNAKLQLVTNFDGRKTPVSQGHGPASASAYVPAIGHAVPQQGGSMHYRHATAPGGPANDDRALTATGTTTWDQKERFLGGRSSNPNLGYLYNEQTGQNIPSVPQIPAQYLERQTSPKLSNYQPTSISLQSSMNSASGAITSPIDVPTLIATKGYNPSNFDIRPLFVGPND